MTHPPSAPGARHLLELDERECWELVSTRTVGRLVWQGTAGLTVVPVNYRTRPGLVVVRTTAYSAAALECDDSPVAFQVDFIDPPTRGGWSVLVRGRAHVEIAGPDNDVDVWPVGPRPLSLTIEALDITGRQLPPTN